MNERELRLRSRIDQLLDRLEDARREREAADAQLTEERQQVAYLNRRVNALLKQREAWKQKASVVHEQARLAHRLRQQP